MFSVHTPPDIPYVWHLSLSDLIFNRQYQDQLLNTRICYDAWWKRTFFISSGLSRALAVFLLITISSASLACGSGNIGEQTSNNWIYFSLSSEFFPSGPPGSPSRPIDEGWYVHSSGIVQYHKTNTGGAVTGNRIHEIADITDVDFANDYFLKFEETVGRKRNKYTSRIKLTEFTGISASYVPEYIYIATNRNKKDVVVYGGLIEDIPDTLMELFLQLRKFMSEDHKNSFVKSPEKDYLQALLFFSKSEKNIPVADENLNTDFVIKILQNPYRMFSIDDVNTKIEVVIDDQGSQRASSIIRRNDIKFGKQYFQILRYTPLKDD